MVEKKDRFTDRMLRTRPGRVLLVLFIIAFVGGCARMPTPEEIMAQREENARQDVELIKPSAKYGNFGEKPLTLEDAIRYGLENNLELRVARFEQEIQSKETLAEKLKMLPGLKAGATWQRRDRLRKSDVYNWALDEDQPDYTVSELKQGTRAELSLTWNVLDSLIAYVRSGASEMKEQVMEWQRNRQAQQLALDITEAYWQAAAVEDALDYVHDVEKNVRGIKRRIETSVGERSLDRMDATEVEMRLKELELTIRQLQANLSNARLQLSRLMGLNQNVQFTLYRPPIKPIVSALPHTKSLNIDRLEEYALLHRPELFASDMQVRIQKEEAKSAVLSMFPGLSFFASTNYDSNRLLLSNDWNTVGAGIGWQLLDLPSRYASYKGRKKAVELAKAQRLMTTVGVITQVHIALLDYAIKADRFRLLEETYQLAANMVNMAREKSDVGRLPQLSVTQRHLEAMAAKLRRDEAVVDLLVAHKRLCVSVGIDPLNCDQLAGAGGGGSGYTASAVDYEATTPEPPGDTEELEPFSDEEMEGDLEDWGGERVAPAELSYGSRSPGWAGGASDQYLWQVQVGAFSRQGGASQRMTQISNADLRVMDPRDAQMDVSNVPGHGRVYRVRFKGLTEADARRISRELRQKGIEYWIIAPSSTHI